MATDPMAYQLPFTSSWRKSKVGLLGLLKLLAFCVIIGLSSAVIAGGVSLKIVTLYFKVAGDAVKIIVWVSEPIFPIMSE
jgi:hypothetical protein